MNRNERFILVLSILISLVFVSLTIIHVEELGPYMGLYIVSYFVAYRVISPRFKFNLLGILLFMIFMIIISMEVLNLIGLQLPKI
jgi:hypothetical protein